jgi:hypothetical protein
LAKRAYELRRSKPSGAYIEHQKLSQRRSFSIGPRHLLRAVRARAARCYLLFLPWQCNVLSFDGKTHLVDLSDIQILLVVQHEVKVIPINDSTVVTI